MYSLPTLDKKLAQIADEKLPKHSGLNKVLEILVQFFYGYYGENDEKWLRGKPKYQHIRVIFWRPNNAMLVGYNYETHASDIPSTFIISANHSFTWKHDGLNFFHEILQAPKSWKVLEEKVIETMYAEIAEDGEFKFKSLTERLYFSKKQLTSSVHSSEKWDENAIFTQLYYEGKEYTDRRLSSEPPCPWEDAVLVYEGIVDKSKITDTSVNYYDLYNELSFTVAEDGN